MTNNEKANHALQLTLSIHVQCPHDGSSLHESVTGNVERRPVPVSSFHDRLLGRTSEIDPHTLELVLAGIGGLLKETRTSVPSGL